MNLLIEHPLLFFSRVVLIRIIFLIWIAFIPMAGIAQIEHEIEGSVLASSAPSLRFEQISLAEGMAQSSGNFIMQDSNGYMWISTQGGLHRYDGYEFKVFQAVPFDTTSLSDSWAWGVTEASNGDLWVGTNRGGVNRLDPISGLAKHYIHDPDDSTSLSSNRAFYPLEASNGDLWVSTLGEGLNRMRSEDDGKFEHFYHDASDLKSITSDLVFVLSEDIHGNIWAASANGLNRIDPETEAITRFLYDDEVDPGYGHSQNVNALYFFHDDPEIFWLATGNGLVRLNVETGATRRYFIELNIDGINPINFLNDVSPDPNDPNILWVGGSGNVIGRFDIRTEKFVSYRNDPSDPNSLAQNEVYSLFLDHSGMMWAGTASEGIEKFNPRAVNFTNIKHDPDDPSSLAPGIVWGIYEDKEGTVWVGTDIGSAGDYLTRFDAKTHKVVRYQHDPNNSETLQAGSLRAFAEDVLGQFWIAGNRGISKFNRKTGKVKRYAMDGSSDSQARSRNDIFALEPALDIKNSLWVASGGGLGRFNTITGEYNAIPLSSDNNSDEPFVACLEIDSQGTLWAGSNKGLYAVNPSGKVELVATYNPSDTTSIRANSIQSIVERKDEPGILWLGLTSGGGLNRFDTRTRVATHITTKDGLADNTIYGLLEDDNGSLWMSTNGGISNYDPDSRRIRNYGHDDGLMALEYNQNAYAKGNEGNLYFGSGKGVTTFVPELLHTNDIPPRVAIADIKLFNKSIRLTSDAKTSDLTTQGNEKTFNYDENELTIDYVALHYANSKNNQYRYQLAGFDKDWVNAGTKRSATYTNLSPGKYTFKVNAANSDGVWNEEGATFQFRVLPPWYRTWWGYLIFVIILAALVFAVDRLQRFRLRKLEKERAVLREAELRAEAENKRRADTEELSKIGRAITSSLSMKKIIDTVYENVNALMDASVFGVGIYNKKDNTIDFPATKEEGKVLPAFSYPMDEKQWLAARCFIHSEEIVIDDFDKEHDDYLASHTAPLAGKSPKSIVYLPLVHQGKTIGAITTQSFSVNAYTEYHINLLRNLANYAAIAMDNASAYRKLDATVDELRSTQEQLVHSEKMASLGELTAGIAHEIQNPLNFVNNFSEVNSELVDELLTEVKNGNTQGIEEIANDLKTNEAKIVEHGERASSIVKGMLQHSRSGSGEKEQTDINAMADEYVRLAYHGLRAKDKSFNANFEADLDEKLPKVNVVPQDIGRVLLNLINNAFHAVSSGSNNRPEKEESDYKPTVTVTTKKLKDSIEIAVKDNGSGIPDDIKDKIFQPFFTTKSAGEGTGLGLSMSYDIITKGHNGELKVNSTLGEGTEFIVILPINHKK